MTLRLDRDGAELFSALCTASAIDELEQVLRHQAASAGVRIFGDLALAAWLSDASIARTVRSVIGPCARPVRAILFDKTAQLNWALGWHQDRTIAVRARMEQPGFDHWTIKSSVTHVEPPFPVIEKMLTARIHIDAVTAANSPLLVVRGSHNLGRIQESEIDAVVARGGTTACLAERGDVWLYRTAILHASKISQSTARRRVLQVDFSSEELPGELEWLGLA